MQSESESSMDNQMNEIPDVNCATMSSPDSKWSIDQIRSYYSEYSSTYDSTASQASYPAPYLIQDWIISHHKNPHHIIDIGCGTGLSSCTFFNKIPLAKIVGIDATQEMLDIAAEKYPFHLLKQLDLESEEFPQVEGEFYSCAVCVGVVEFILDLDSFMTKVYECLEHGGVFGLSIPTDFDLPLKEFRVLQDQQVFGYEDSKSGESVNYRCLLLLKK